MQGERPALGVTISRLKKRADFVAAGQGSRSHCVAFSLHCAQPKASTKVNCARLGFTVTKKVGTAVVRNRVRRRLKEAVRCAPALPFVACNDYVMIARIESLIFNLAQLQTELARALSKAHSPLKSRAITGNATHSKRIDNR